MRVVDSRTETFKLVELLDPHVADSKIDDWENHLDQRLQKIERLFLERKASPHDVDLNGRTLLHAALKRGRTSVDEPNEAGLTPLHLASNWPDGLSLLLDHGADHDKTDSYGEKPVKFAIFHVCVESVQLLLKAGCSFDLRDNVYGTGNVFACAADLYLFPHWMRSIRTSRNDHFKILKIVIRELALRQGEVISSMIDVPILTRSKVSMSDDGQHFRSGAATSYPSVREGATRLQSILPGIRTPYHFPDLTVKIANELWNAGFREIDLPDEDYQTPLMMITGLDLRRVIELALWLYQKGAALHRPRCATLPPGPKDVRYTTSRSGPRAIHFLAAALKMPFLDKYEAIIISQETTRNFSALEGAYPGAIEHIIDDLSLDGRQFLHRILLDESPDGCLCACSGHGCMPMTQLLKLKRGWLFWLAKDAETVISAWIRRWVFENVPTEHLSTVSSQEIVRLITFEELGLRHTCCDYDYIIFNTPEPEEAAEIRDEDHEGIQLLESLLLEFEEKRGNEDIKSFIGGYWSTRMEEVLAARDELPIDRTAMREVGVVLQDADGNTYADVETE
ncbi:MAG: hypothetical protein Q9207_005076 [Kuettlingeria erythrocarpa]